MMPIVDNKIPVLIPAVPSTAPTAAIIVKKPKINRIMIPVPPKILLCGISDPLHGWLAHHVL